MVRKKVVLNACGVKSLGGVKLFVEAFELLSEAETEIIVLHSENEFYLRILFLLIGFLLHLLMVLIVSR